MAADNEPAKSLLPYLQRADELQKHEPLVAYYCRLYAMERGLKIPQNERTKTTNSLLVSLMKQLEKDRKSLNLLPDDHLHLEGFALSVFAKADKQDRAGRADLNTAKTFYAASIFFEILNQFGESAPELEQKQKYAVWKAAEIRKAIKEGRKPVPGPPDGETDLNVMDVEVRNSGDDIIRGPEQENPTMSFPQIPDGLGRQSSINIPPVLPSVNIFASPPSFPSGDYTPHIVDYPPKNHQPDHPSHDYSSHTADHPPQNYEPDQQSGDYSPHTADYLPQNYQPDRPSGRPENPTYPQPYHAQSYPQETRHPSHIPQNSASQDSPTPFAAYPNFQTYPSFSDSSLPAVPSQYPSHHQTPDASYSYHSAISATNYSTAPEYNPSSTNGNAPHVPTSTAQVYHYDSNYQVPPEKIADAQKAARFAVGALAFDEVPVAIEHLKKALELLTNQMGGR